MAERPKGYGMTAELQAKKDSKWDSHLAGETADWLITKLGNSSDGAALASELRGLNFDTPDALHEKLKNGVILCHVINAIRPGSVRKINTNKMAFKQMENIGNFLSACQAYGCAAGDLFQTVDLYEANNMPQVVNGIHALGRKDNSLGPKEAQANKREFTDEQLRSGQGVIGLQMGSNKGATQAGQNFGKTRSILD